MVLSVVPLTLLAIAIFVCFRILQSQTAIADTTSELPIPVATQSVVVEAKSASPDERSPESIPAAPSQAPILSEPDASIGDAENKKEEIWQEITDAISGLNELVGVEMFLDVKRGDKGQMEVLLDNSFWKRVRYQTRVDLKTDISNLWHLYVIEYGHAGSSVVYFINEPDGRVIDIFSRAR